MMVLDPVGDQEAILYAQLGQQPLVRTTQTSLEPRLGTLPHETKRSSDALKDPSIRRAVSTLVYATPLHPAQRHLPVNLHPPNSAPFFGQVGWQVHAGGGHAGADSTVKMTTHEVTTRLHCWALKDTTALWAAATFMFLEMPLNATAAHILVAAAAFGGPHAKGWPALSPQVTSPFAPAWSIHGT